MTMAQRSAQCTATAILFVLGACGSDPPSSPTTGTTTTGMATTSTVPPDASSSGSSSGALDTSSGGGSSGTTEGASSSGTTGNGIDDPGCPNCAVLVDGLMSGRGLSLHGDYVYFTDQSAGTVNRVLKTGGEVEALMDLQSEPYHVVANDEQFFWTTFTPNGSVWRANLPDGPPLAVALSADSFPRMLELSGDYIYWCAFDDIEGRVRRVLATGLGNPPETLVAVGSGVADLTVSGNQVFFTVHEIPDMPGMAPPGVVYGAAADVPTDVLDLVVVGADQSEPWGVAASADTVYWLNGLGNPDDQPQSVVSTPAVGGQPLEVLVSDQAAPWGIALDEQYVYWTDHTRVNAVAVGGGDRIELARMQTIARSIAVDADDVFWITQERVLRRAKP